MKLTVLRKKRVLITLICIPIICALLFAAIFIPLMQSKRGNSATYTVTEKKFYAKSFTIILDAGHGGIDGGVSGVNTKTKESTINLTITLSLAESLKNKGFNVVLTRSTEGGLYGSTEKGFKRRDMNARKKIIEESHADCVISIHCNKYPNNNCRGIKVFYNDFSSEGYNFSTIIAGKLNEINKQNLSKTYAPQVGDYFMLKCTRKPSCLIECGFLSNPEDEKLLLSSAYQDQVVRAISDGVEEYVA